MARSWTAKFFGGPLEGQLMAVDRDFISHHVTSMESPLIRTYIYKKWRQIAPHGWLYKLDEIMDESKPFYDDLSF